jgi:acetolactate synthase-1/2/3 large subunit
MKVSDFIAEQLYQFGIRKVFMVTGGGSMHLNDSIGSFSKFDTMYNHHEQACSIAAESYARLTNEPALLNVTTGPGGINAINGVFGAWTDSIPMIIISGQVRYDTTIDSSELPLRQLGDQEVDIVSMVSGITKYAKMMYVR